MYTMGSVVNERMKMKAAVEGGVMEGRKIM